VLAKEGFKPMVYCVDDPIAAKRPDSIVTHWSSALPELTPPDLGLAGETSTGRAGVI
jgi:hypothetical protein